MLTVASVPYPYACRQWLRTRRASVASPFIDLNDLPGGADLIPLLQEAGDMEVEFDAIGRRLKQLGLWPEYSDLWTDALGAALKQRQTATGAP